MDRATKQDIEGLIWWDILIALEEKGYPYPQAHELATLLVDRADRMGWLPTRVDPVARQRMDDARRTDD